MIIMFKVSVDIRAIQVRHDTNTCGWTKYTTKLYEESWGSLLRLLQSNTRLAYSVGQGVKAMDGWNNEQHGHFSTVGNVNIE